MAVAITEELAMALLDELKTANEHIARDILPNFPCTIRLERTPRPRLIIEYSGDLEADPGRMGYPSLVSVSGVLRPTDEFRRRLGLPKRED